MSNVIFNPSLLNWSSLILTVSHVFIYLFLRFIHLLNDLLILYPVVYFIYWFIYVPTLFIELAIYFLIYLWPFSIYQSITSKKKMTKKKKTVQRQPLGSAHHSPLAAPLKYLKKAEVTMQRTTTHVACEKNCNHEGLKLRFFFGFSTFLWVSHV